MTILAATKPALHSASSRLAACAKRKFFDL
jgi:hypothetical protein